MPRRRQLVQAARPVHPELERLRLSFSLDKMREFLGPDSPHVKQLLGAESPDALAARLVEGTRLAAEKPQQVVKQQVPFELSTEFATPGGRPELGRRFLREHHRVLGR